MSHSTLTRKGQVTIPKSLRDRLGLHPGDRISFHLRGDEIILKPVHPTILDLQGSVKPKNRPEDFDSIQALLAYTERNVDFIDAYHAVFLGRRRDVSLATFDRKHFRRFPDLDLVAL